VSRVRRNYVATRNMLHAYPAFWERGFWASVKVAHRAQRQGAMQKLRELAPLLALARRVSPRTIVEIGTAQGGTFYAWCQVAEPDATIVSIDLPGGPFGGRDAAADVATLRRFGRRGQQLHFLRADSHDTQTRAHLEEIVRGRPIDFLMIDGDHTYEGVKQDFEMYAPLVREGNPIALHDILPHPHVSSCEVDRFWNELRIGRRHLEFIDRQPDDAGEEYGGIGVVYREADQRFIASR
jgi:predicted O-methyltransferase YrrM